MQSTREKNTFICTTFSPAMLTNLPAEVKFQRLSSSSEAARLLLPGANIVDAPGHGSTAQVAYLALGRNVPEVDPNNRPVVKAESGDTLVVFQYSGPRLSEGQILSNDEVSRAERAGHFSWLLVTVK